MKRDYYYKNLHFSVASISEDISRYLPEYIDKGIVASVMFDFDKCRDKTLGFIKEMKYGKSIGVYRYSRSCSKPNIYSSIYACMTLSLYGELEKLSLSEKKEWIDYLDSFQSEVDGLFRDKSIMNEIFEDSDWWGARHLTAHIISAYTQLGGKPKYKFSFLDKYSKNDTELAGLLKDIDIDNQAGSDDNKIMNLVVLMQYSRDILGNSNSDHAIKRIYAWLDKRINKETGLWGKVDVNNKNELSRAVQFTYHIVCLYLYDNKKIKYVDKLISSVIKTQNILGGFGVTYNSSACEDIDSIFLLCKLTKKEADMCEAVRTVLAKSFPWVMANMNDDGGFVFKLNEPFVYGHRQMSAKISQSAMFPTWFRTLSIAYLTKYLGIKNGYTIIRCPGVEQ